MYVMGLYSKKNMGIVCVCVRACVRARARVCVYCNEVWLTQHRVDTTSKGPLREIQMSLC